MKNPVIGFIGFGEAAYLISRGLLSEGIKKIVAFDVMAQDAERGKAIRARATELDVELVPSLGKAIDTSDIIFCATSAKVAEPIAREAAPLLKSLQIYIDLNAASPMVMETISTLIEGTEALFVDGAVMAPVPGKGHKVPIFISGKGAKVFENQLSNYGMNLTLINETAGSSSAIKMFRSIFMKGFTMLLLETLEASHKYGVTEIIMNSLGETLTTKPLEETANTLLNRTAIHAERRVSEMSEVLHTLEHMDLDGTMSQAVKNKLQRIVALKLKDFLKNEVPKDYVDVLKALQELEK